jgi:hypothetical protein
MIPEPKEVTFKETSDSKPSNIVYSQQDKVINPQRLLILIYDF